MRLFKSYSMLTVLFTAMLMSACNTDENPCPGVGLEVDIDSANLTANVIATGLDDIAFDLYVNDQLIKSVGAGELDSVDLNFQFEPGEYKICVSARSESCDREIEGCVEFKIENPNREECLGLEFRSDMIDNYNYKFFADFEGIETIEYVWVVDGDVVKEEPLTDNRTNFLEWDFEAGEHSVCIVAENDECGEVSYCEEIVIENDCVEEVAFEAEQENHYTYYFYADFAAKEHIKYKWYVNDDLVEVEIPGEEETDHKLIWQFDTGTHNVCIVSDQDGCESVEYCETIEIEEVQCVELNYTAELTETDSTDFYTFTADFAEKEDVTYIWKVFINDDFQHQEVRHADSGDDHQFVWHFEPGVEYEVCLKQDECQDNQICEIFSVD
ncbi:hypothetical protein [Ekhidna sp.]|uniref:hypothetical protein n=1 Tax=Ekhidna sp. TaxID=2608089 RepID=UPI00329A4BE4